MIRESTTRRTLVTKTTSSEENEEGIRTMTTSIERGDLPRIESIRISQRKIPKLKQYHKFKRLKLSLRMPIWLKKVTIGEILISDEIS